jgi:hypothetical protein
MVLEDQQAKATTLRSLREDGNSVLSNAWHAGSAAMIARAASWPRRAAVEPITVGTY